MRRPINCVHFECERLQSVDVIVCIWRVNRRSASTSRHCRHDSACMMMMMMMTDLESGHGVICFGRIGSGHGQRLNEYEGGSGWGVSPHPILNSRPTLPRLTKIILLKYWQLLSLFYQKCLLLMLECAKFRITYSMCARLSVPDPHIYVKTLFLPFHKSPPPSWLKRRYRLGWPYFLRPVLHNSTLTIQWC